MKKLLSLILLLIPSCEKDTVAPDTTAPTVVVTYPVNESTLTETTTVTVDVADAGEIGVVQVQVDADRLEQGERQGRKQCVVLELQVALDVAERTGVHGCEQGVVVYVEVARWII